MRRLRKNFDMVLYGGGGLKQLRTKQADQTKPFSVGDFTFNLDNYHGGGNICTFPLPLHSMLGALQYIGAEGILQSQEILQKQPKQVYISLICYFDYMRESTICTLASRIIVNATSSGGQLKN